MMIFLFICLCIQAVTSELIHVHVIFRHGDRSPVVIYPNDPHQKNAWPRGLGELTEVGMNQHFDLGKYTRKRYNNSFLQETYNVSQIYVRSTDVDRTLMSAQCNLAGLYFPWNPNNQFNKILKWNPVPIHTVPVADDNILYGGQLCDRADQLMNKVFASSSVQKMVKENQQFFDMLEEKTGMPAVNLSNEWEIVDVSICEKAHNLSVPSWITPAVMTKLRAIDDYAWNLKFSTLELRRLRGGSLLYQILSHIQALTRSPPAEFSKGKKMIMYSGHDFTVSDLMYSAHIDNGLQPPYASAVFVELHRINNNYEVQFFYRNDSSRDPYPLTVRGCTQSCPVTKLVSLLSSETLHPDDYRESCKISDSSSLSRDLSYSFGFLCVAGVICVLALITAYIVRRTRYRRYRQMNNIQVEDGNM